MPAQRLVDKHSLKILNMEPVNIPSNTSHHRLMNGEEDSDSAESGVNNESTELETDRVKKSRTEGLTPHEIFTVAILCFVNLINYMDRFTIAGVLKDVVTYFGVNQAEGGLLQSVFVLSYMVFAPVFGYLGDRYSRRYVMAVGVLVWSVTTLAGSFMTNFYWFATFRALVGIGEASYSTIAPTVISDLFFGRMRTKMLTIFYFAIPVGSGLGYITGSGLTSLFGEWQWALRFTPGLGIVAVLLLLFGLKDPVRGESEGRTELSSTTWVEDLKALCRNRSFILSTAGFTCVAFVTGALGWWGPTYIHMGLVLQTGHANVSEADVAYKFGIITMISGIVGVPLGGYLAQRLRDRFPNTDPLVCAYGLLVSAPLVFFALVSVDYDSNLCYALIFFGEVSLNLSWSIVADMLLSVVIPTRRSTAEAFQILISHAFGDAGSPYLIGVIADSLGSSYNGTEVDPSVVKESFYGLQYALFTTIFVEVLGGIFFLLTSLYILRDQRAALGVDDDEQPRNLYADQTYLTSEQSRNLVT